MTDIEIQAEKLYDFAGRGGNIRKWLKSKGFAEMEKDLILKLFVRMIEEDDNA